VAGNSDAGVADPETQRPGAWNCQFDDTSVAKSVTHSRLGRDLLSYPDSTMDIPRALSHYRSAEAIVSQAPDSSALGYVCYGMAVTADWGVSTDDGLAAAERATDIAVRLGNDRLRRHTATQHGFHLIAAGRLAEGFAELESTWHEADAANDLTGAFTSTWITAGLSIDLGHPDAARTWCKRELEKPRLTQAPTPANPRRPPGLGTCPVR
jgi:hypothetical protein